MKTILKKDFQCQDPLEGIKGWKLKKGSEINILYNISEKIFRCEYLQYGFDIHIDYL